MKIQITFREGKDEDLIKWYQNAISGDRAFIIRSAIRQYLYRDKTQHAPVMKVTANNKPKTNILNKLTEW